MKRTNRLPGSFAREARTAVAEAASATVEYLEQAQPSGLSARINIEQVGRPLNQLRTATYSPVVSEYWRAFEPRNYDTPHAVSVGLLRNATLQRQASKLERTRLMGGFVLERKERPDRRIGTAACLSLEHMSKWAEGDIGLRRASLSMTTKGEVFVTADDFTAVSGLGLADELAISLIILEGTKRLGPKFSGRAPESPDASKIEELYGCLQEVTDPEVELPGDVPSWLHTLRTLGSSLQPAEARRDPLMLDFSEDPNPTGDSASWSAPSSLR